MLHVTNQELQNVYPFIPTTKKKVLNRKFSAMSQTTFCNGSKINEKTVQNNLAGRVFETLGLNSLERSFFSLSCQANLIAYVVQSRHQQMLLRYKQIQSYITSKCTSDIRLYLCVSNVHLAVSRLKNFIRSICTESITSK